MRPMVHLGRADAKQAEVGMDVAQVDGGEVTPLEKLDRLGTRLASDDAVAVPALEEARSDRCQARAVRCRSTRGDWPGDSATLPPEVVVHRRATFRCRGRRVGARTWDELPLANAATPTTWAIVTKQVSQMPTTRMLHEWAKRVPPPIVQPPPQNRPLCVGNAAVLRSILVSERPRNPREAAFGIYLNLNKQYISAKKTPHLIVGICDQKQNGLNVEQVGHRNRTGSGRQGSLAFHGCGSRPQTFDGQAAYFFRQFSKSFS